MNIIGIDFGHGETSAGYVNSETRIANEIPMLHDLKITGEDIVIPTVICKMENDEYIISPTPNQIANSNEFRAYFKAPLVESPEYEKISDDNRFYFQKFLSLTFQAICSNTNNPYFTNEGENGVPNYVVYVACPSGWNTQQIDAYKDFLAHTCNIPVADIVKESRAAYIAARRRVGGVIRDQKGNVLVIDFGSSTVDFTLFNNDLIFEPIHEGYPFGASKIETAFFDYFLENDKESAANIQYLYKTIGSDNAKNLILFAIRKQKEEFFKQANHDTFNLSIPLDNLLLDRSLRGRFIESPEGGFSQNDIERILHDYIDKLSEMLDSFKTKFNIEIIDRVILTGGASRMYFFADLVAEKYNVSRETQTLIIDLDPSVTISQGIAAFGCMNEEAKKVEEPLWGDVDDFINNKLETLLRKTIVKSVGDMYKEEFLKITKNYTNGRICKDGNRNLDALEDAYLKLLGTWSSDSSIMDDMIQKSVVKSMKTSIEETLSRYAKQWGLGTADVSVSIPNLDMNLSLTAESCNCLNRFIWQTIRNFINRRDFFGWTDNSPYRDRDYDDRKGVAMAVDNGLNSYFQDLHYDEPLVDEITLISSAIRTSVQDFIDKAKLEQYR